MASGWTSKYAILRDLSVAQGREVPIEIKNTVTQNEKPPVLNCTEETEQEFFENLVTNGDFSTGPDTTLIQQMLDMVREIDVKDAEGVNNNTLVEISKIPIHQGSGDGTQLQENIKDSIENKKRLKWKKNVAVASLIAACGDNSENEVPEIPNLLKLYDFVSGNENNKLNASLKPLRTHTQKEKDVKTVVSPTFMFKKKSQNPKSADGSLYKQNFSPISVQAECVSPSESIIPGCFVPSSHAGEYYKKYVERIEMEEKVNEDIWSRAKRQMKEIDAKRKKQSTLLQTTSVQKYCEAEELNGIDHIQLPKHRHTLPEECKVCKVLCTEKKK